MGIKIITDNCCDLSQEILQQYHIGVTHLLVRVGDRVYLPDELSNAEFYAMQVQSSILPQTSQPSVEEMTRVYSEALEDGSEVIAIHMSSGISGTYQGGELARNILENERLHVIDSKKASVGQGLLVLEAARMAERGETADAILQRLQEMKKRVQCIFMVGKLEYLIKGGRVSKAKGTIAEVFDIKPILYFDEEGCIMPLDKARGFKGALKKVLNIMENMGDDLSHQTVGLCHGASPETAAYLAEEIQKRFHVKEIIIGEVGPVIGAHVGPGTASVFFEK